jgi:hypothetical protein
MDAGPLEIAAVRTTAGHAPAVAESGRPIGPVSCRVLAADADDGRLADQLGAALVGRDARAIGVAADAAAAPLVLVVAVDARDGAPDALVARWRAATADGPVRTVVAIDGMRRVGNEYESFKAARAAIATVARAIGVAPVAYVPVSSAIAGNVALPAPEIEWYDGPPLVDVVLAAARAGVGRTA